MTASGGSRRGPLDGTRVLDLTTERGAYAARLLADLGADVVRVEPPGGDPMRALPPFLNDEPLPDRSLSHWYYNAGKRSAVADLSTEAGRDFVCAIAANSDLLIESHDPGALAGAGLGYSDLVAIHPSLVYVSISPFGQTGPWRNYAADDLVLCALGGMMGVCGDHGRPPLVAFGQQAYHTAGTYAAISAIAALRAVRLGGRGQHLDVSIEACVAAVIEHVNVFYLYERRVAQRQDGLQWSLNFQVFRALDGYIVLSLNHQWDMLVAWLESDGMADDLTDSRYADREARRAALPHIIEVLGRWAATKPVRPLFHEGQLRRFPFGAVETIDGLVANPHLRARGFFTDVPHPHLGRDIAFLGPPFRALGMEGAPRRAPLPGEHTEAIRSEIAAGGAAP